MCLRVRGEDGDGVFGCGGWREVGLGRVREREVRVGE